MKIEKVLDVLNEALAQRDFDLWLKKERIKDLEKEIEDLKAENTRLVTGIEELKGKKDW